MSIPSKRSQIGRPGLLDVEIRGLGLEEMLLVGLQGLLDLGRGEFLDLLGRTANEGAGVEEGVELVQDRGEEGGAADALDEVVVLSELLDVVGGLVGENTCGILVSGVKVICARWKGAYGFPRGHPGGTVPS